MNYIGIDGKVHNDTYLMHFNPYHDKLGRFASRTGGGGVSRSAQISTHINKIDNKTGKLQTKSAKYKEKSAKYNRKANKIKRMAANPLIGRTDFREAANYAALRAEGKSLKYEHKAEKLNKKVAKLDQERTKLGKERVDALKTEHNLKMDMTDYRMNHKLTASTFDGDGNKIGTISKEALTSPKLGRIDSESRNYATEELYKHYKKYPQFYNTTNKKMSKDEFKRHVLLDEIHHVPSQKRYDLYYVDDFTETSYPDNTWLVSYDDKNKKIDKTNSQYYR